MIVRLEKFVWKSKYYRAWRVRRERNNLAGCYKLKNLKEKFFHGLFWAPLISRID